MTVEFRLGHLARRDSHFKGQLITTYKVNPTPPFFENWGKSSREFDSPTNIEPFSGHPLRPFDTLNQAVSVVDKWKKDMVHPPVCVHASSARGQGAQLQIGDGRISHIRAGEKVFVGKNGVVKNKKQAFLIATGT